MDTGQEKQSIMVLKYNFDVQISLLIDQRNPYQTTLTWPDFEFETNKLQIACISIWKGFFVFLVCLRPATDLNLFPGQSRTELK